MLRHQRLQQCLRECRTSSPDAGPPPTLRRLWRVTRLQFLVALLWQTGVQVAAEPFGGQLRGCVSGQECSVSNVAGTGLANGDRLALLQTCGQGPKIAGLPGALGATQTAVGSGKVLKWAGEITVDGGEYKMCWCSATADCTGFSGFATHIGTLTVTGPLSGMTKTCTGGRTCDIQGIGGVYLRTNDSVQVLTSCGTSPGVSGFPNDARTTHGALAGTEHGWGEARIAANGGVYSMCWCAKGETCIEGVHHRKQIGTLTLIGPTAGFMKTCFSYSACTWSGMTGQGLKTGDRIMLLEDCGAGSIIPGFPNNDIAVAKAGGVSYDFPGSDNVVTAGGHEYAMCWCANDGGVCASPANFIVRAGTLKLIGPRTDNEISCVRGRTCKILDFKGVGLTNSDKLKALHVCGQGTSPGGFPNSGDATATNFGAEYTTWTGAMQAQYGSYRMCWCGNGWSCPPVSGYKMDAGVLWIVGVDANQQKSCHNYDGCSIAGITGNYLKDGDLMKVLTSCDGTGSELPGWPLTGLSLAATSQGSSFSWGIVERVTTDPGTYKMCWCPLHHSSKCDDKADFLVEAGDLQLRGPSPMSKNGSCSAFQMPNCIIGPFNDGVGLTPGTDKVVMVRNNESCRDDERDYSVGGTDMGIPIKNDGLIYFKPSDLPFGGIWKLCYCANHDSTLDSDKTPCSTSTDYPTAVGLLYVNGAYPGQSVRCTRNQVCEFNLKGHGMDKDIHQIAVRDSTTQCSANTKLEDATRRRRDFTGNPYLATARVSADEITFIVNPVQTLMTFYICFCAPPPASGSCGGATLATFDQLVGSLDIRGANADQKFICGRGGQCDLKIKGRGLGVKDFIKIVNMTTDCVGDVVTDGFFISLSPAAPAPDTTETQSTFKLGRVTAKGSYRICYCASLSGCDANEKYNHIAGILTMLDPLQSMTLKSATASSLRVNVDSRIENIASFIRCAAAEYEPRAMPTAADVTNGLGRFGLGMGEAPLHTRNGTNELDIYFKIFVLPGQQYRIWCFDTSAQSFILPDSVGGNLAITDQDITAPKVKVYPSFLWSGAKFHVELSGVFDAAVTRGRRLTDTTLVRVNTGASAAVCNRMRYDDAFNMSVFDAGDVGKSDVVLVSNFMLKASAFQPFLCFWSGPKATGISMEADRVTVQNDQPSYTQRSISGETLTRFYRGVFMQAIFTNAPEHKGLMHWTTQEAFDNQGCADVIRVPPDAQVVSGTNTSFFRINNPPGKYVMCYLGKGTESSTAAPFNGIGGFELTDTITKIRQDPTHPSTRNTVRLQLEVRMTGTIICIARAGPADVTPADFDANVAFQGRASLQVEPVEDGVDPEFPRLFTLSVPLMRYQKTVGPLHVWCFHSQAELLVFPPNRNGIRITLQDAEPQATPDPAYIWNGTRFKLQLHHTPPIDTKYLSLHEPALPPEWEWRLVSDGGVRKVKYNKIGGLDSQDEHPAYQAFLEGDGPDPCEGADVKNAVQVSEKDFTETKEWLQGSSTAPFVCYWASRTSFPHLISVLTILAQPPEYTIEVSGQISPFVFRGVQAIVRMRHTSKTGGRILVVRKPEFENFGGVCQEMGLKPLRLLYSEEELISQAETIAPPQSQRRQPPQAPRRLQSGDGGVSADCTNAPQKTSSLLVIPATEVFPVAEWGIDLSPGLNCSRDYKLYWNPALINTNVLADAERSKYVIVTSNASVLKHFVKIRLLTAGGVIPNTSVAVVQEDFKKEDLANLPSQSWVLRTQDCLAQVLLAPASPMYEPGAEDLPLSEYLKASLMLDGISFFAIIYMPDLTAVLDQNHICKELQPPPPVPKRPESLFDIDQPGLGRTVRSGMVYVPSVINGTGSFLHTDPMNSYMICYIGDETVETPVFNPLSTPFESQDVLPVERFLVPSTPQSNSVQAHLNVTSQIRGKVRCLALLRNENPPTIPDQVFKPDMKSDDFLGFSDLMQFDIPGSSLLITIMLHPGQVKFVTASASFAKAPPTLYVWCAHQSSTILYPSDGQGYMLDIRARPPPPMVYRQMNRTITEVALTLSLEFSDIVAVFDDPRFPVNAYDEVQFSTRPAMPDGLEIDATTGAISGIPSKSGVFERTIVASSKNPPGGSSVANLKISVDDVLGLKRRFVNVESVLFSIVPRSTSIFRADEFVLLLKLKVQPFSNTPSEFFCVGDLQANNIPYTNTSTMTCRSQGGACCCTGYIMRHLKIQDVRITNSECELALTKKYHTRGMVLGMLAKAEGVLQQTALSSVITQDFLMPEETDATLKAPVLFDLVISMDWEDYNAMGSEIDDQLKTELFEVVAIPRKLITIDSAEQGKGGVRFKIFFNVEPRCMESASTEVEMLSFGINPQAGCNRIAPEEYMNELKEQLQLADSAIFARDDLPYLKRVSFKHSFSLQKVMFFCRKQPIWEYAAIVEEPSQCPYDLLKLGWCCLIGGTIALAILAGGICYISYEFASLSFLYKTRVLDILTPLLALYTVIADYQWILLLKMNSAHALHDTMFLGGLCHMFLCFCINALSVRITITSYIQDTPWWRRNRQRLKLVLFLSCLTPRFLRITRAQMFGFETTQIHFGTPSKMAVVFSNLGIVSLFQDILQVMVQAYVFFIWRNQAPKPSLVCIVLGIMSINVGILHHVFSRSQRAAYERVVKLLGVRRLTAGFFDVSAAAAVGTAGRENNNAIALRSAGEGNMEIELGEDEDENAGPLDPTKLDPISAALYVSQMYEKETLAAKKAAHRNRNDGSESSSGSSSSSESEENSETSQTQYPKHIFDKLKKFYNIHDPSKLNTIALGPGNLKVDEGRLDAELKAKFGHGLDSVETN